MKRPKKKHSSKESQYFHQMQTAIRLQFNYRGYCQNETRYDDLHLHSCLSPCGSEDMTPNNIVNMAKLMGYDMIALTDHNSCLNCEATVTVGKRNGLTVVPGMELCTAEDDAYDLFISHSCRCNGISSICQNSILRS